MLLSRVFFLAGGFARHVISFLDAMPCDAMHVIRIKGRRGGKLAAIAAQVNIEAKALKASESSECSDLHRSYVTCSKISIKHHAATASENTLFLTLPPLYFFQRPPRRSGGGKEKKSRSLNSKNLHTNSLSILHRSKFEKKYFSPLHPLFLHFDLCAWK